MLIYNIIEYNSHSIKDSYGKEIKIDTLNADLDYIYKSIIKFKRGTIVARESMRIMEYNNFDKYYRLMKMFNFLKFEYILLYPKDEIYYKTFDIINKIDYPKGRYICMFLEDEKTNITVIDC